MFNVLRLILAVASVGFSIFSVLQFSSSDVCEGTQITIIIIWAIGPPTWFFLEYFSLDKELVRLGSDSTATKELLLTQVKVYSDLASKVWAAILAVLIIIYTK